VKVEAEASLPVVEATLNGHITETRNDGFAEYSVSGNPNGKYSYW
jgi:hypothetical protein|tara:strand:+ start:520 stop:654 length:135 start_codon:yes stop_codon:yes gene_type:complete